MSINVGTDWRWRFDLSSSTLVLEQSAGAQIDTDLPAKLLIPDAQLGAEFDMDDANSFQCFYEQLRSYIELPEEALQQLVCKAAAAKRFYKPVMPKSWFFLPSAANLTLDEGYAVELDTPSQPGLFMAIEVGEKATLFMLLGDSLSLSEGKTMLRGDMIKVMNDRVARYATVSAFGSGYGSISA